MSADLISSFRYDTFILTIHFLYFSIDPVIEDSSIDPFCCSKEFSTTEIPLEIKLKILPKTPSIVFPKF